VADTEVNADVLVGTSGEVGELDTIGDVGMKSDTVDDLGKRCSLPFLAGKVEQLTQIY
jgi:hypothetical protein